MKLRIQGTGSLLVHNGKVTTNPLNPLTKAIKKISSKRNKVDEDYEALAKLEWLGSFYLTEKHQFEVKGNEVIIKKCGLPCMDTDCLEAMLITGAKKNKLGTQFKSGVLVKETPLLEYEGSRNLEELWREGTHTDMRKVRIQKNSIIRTRPVFHEWAIAFTVDYLPSLVNPDQIAEAVTKAGTEVGLCDFRPKFGQFVAMTDS
jgi:hypothetical protein